MNKQLQSGSTNGPPGSENGESRTLHMLPSRNRIDKDTLTASSRSAKLLDQWGTCYLFEINEARRTRYLVEADGERWRFGILFSARAKFDRLAARQGRSLEGTKDSR